MIIDAQLLFSDSQAVTVTANSSNVVDTIAAGMQLSGMVTNPIGCFARVLQAFAGGTSLQISLVSADDAALSTNLSTHFTTPAIPAASLIAGLLALGANVPAQKIRRYMGLKYTVVGTMTAGTIIAGLAENVDSVMHTSDFAKGFTAL
jgi:hypothetical protein